MLWNGPEIIRNHSPLPELLKATGTTMRITNQKNGVKGQTVYHEALKKKRCPIRGLAHRVHHILSNGGEESTIILAYKITNGIRLLSAEDIVEGIRLATVALRLDKNRYTPEMVGSHSLRAGGAMAMKLNGIDRDIIRKVGRWSSDTFLMYLHEQIAQLTAGVSKAMSQPQPMFNIMGKEP